MSSKAFEAYGPIKPVTGKAVEKPSPRRSVVWVVYEVDMKRPPRSWIDEITIAFPNKPTQGRWLIIRFLASAGLLGGLRESCGNEPVPYRLGHVLSNAEMVGRVVVDK
jgi:hypothetical protein